jgi:hypothetical protein
VSYLGKVVPETVERREMLWKVRDGKKMGVDEIRAEENMH